jgi:two-component system, sensor histidine kinase and response regulator
MASQQKSTRVLLVDDDPAILEAVTDLLELNSYEVATAADGRAALTLMVDFTPDVIISDIAMPGMDGLEFFSEVRQKTELNSLPFIFLTARGQKADIQYGYTVGVDDYIIKPFEPSDLIVKIEARLKRVRQIRAAADTETERIKQQLLAMFSHELRTPLTYIYGYSNLLLEERASLDEDDINKMLSGVQSGAERLVRLVEDLMLVVRIENGILQVEIEKRSARVLVGDILDRIQSNVATSASARNVKLDIQADRSLAVRGISQYLEDALLRLVDNAVRFTRPNGGVITIAAQSLDGVARIMVQDEGVGMSPADQERAFELFTQIDRDVQEQQGVGLGLSVARKIIEAHNGTISLTSQPGVGTVVELILPLAA